MNTSQESPPSGPAPVGDASGAALVAALEGSSAAIWCLAGTELAPVWANARARDLGTAPGDLAAVTGHRVAELAGEVARTGHAETVHGAVDPGGRAATVVLQPLQVHGQPGVLVLLEADHTDCEHVAGVVAAADVVDQVQHSLLPPALPLLPDDGSAHFLPLTPRPPLGTLPGAPSVAATAQLPQGSTLVLFSDGAVAASGALSAEGLVRLAEVSRDALTAPGALEGDAPGELAAAIVEGLLGSEEHPDDIAVLVAHRGAETTEPLELDLAAVPAALPTVRRHLGAWLARLGMGGQDRVGVMVAVGEATANAAEHAYRGVEPGRMQVTAAVDVDGLLTVTVRDQGRWRPPDRDPGDRGRGLLIMRQLVDGVVLQGEHGTTVTLSMRLRRSPEQDEDRPGGRSAAEVVVDRGGECPVVRASGVVDMVGAEQMRIRLLEASHGGTGRVELDLTAVTLFSR